MSSEAANILSELRDRSIEVAANGENIAIRPIREVTEDELARIREHKPAILSLLRGDYWHEQSDRADFAETDAEAAQGKPVYQPGVPPLATPTGPADFEADLMILAFALHRTAEHGRERGWGVSEQFARLIRDDLKPVARVVGPIHKKTRR